MTRYEAKSVVFGRKPRVEGDEFKCAFFKIYSIDNPLKNESFPEKELDFPNTEKVEIRGIDVDYYLEGNDLVIDNITAITITQKENTVFLSVEK
jgi:hypothetical protein